MFVLVVTILFIAALLAYEVFALLTGRELVTMTVRKAIWAYPPLAFLLGLVMAHFAWCP